MIITEVEANQYKLDQKMLAAKVSWRNIKKGGMFLCPECGAHLQTLGAKHTSFERIDVPICPACSYENPIDGEKVIVPAVLKYAQPTGLIVARATLADGTVVTTELHRRKGEKKDLALQKTITLGRLNKAVKLGMTHYMSPSHAERKTRNEI